MTLPSRIPPGVRAVFFDAVGTLLHPLPSAAEAYAEIGKRHGSARSLPEIARRFTSAFRAEEQYDASQQHRTTEEREIQRWQRIVAAVLDDVADRERCFAALYEHFARPDAWRCEPGTAAVLARLRGAGFVVGLASNFDHRLHNLVAALPELAAVGQVAISSELGWKKPAPAFFTALTALTGLDPDQILVVGDDLDNDYHGARAAGMPALLFAPRGRHVLPGVERITALAEIVAGG